MISTVEIVTFWEKTVSFKGVKALVKMLHLVNLVYIMLKNLIW